MAPAPHPETGAETEWKRPNEASLPSPIPDNDPTEAWKTRPIAAPPPQVRRLAHR